MSLGQTLLSSAWLLLPCAIANMTPVFARKINFLNYPLDFNKKWKGKPILGKNKTYRGFFFGIITATLIVFLQKLLHPSLINISIIDYSNINILMLGFLAGFGALFGDSVESFIKRRLNIAPGKSFIPWDQIDWPTGGLLFISIAHKLPIEIIISGIIVAFVAHVLARYTGSYLKINKKKW